MIFQVGRQSGIWIGRRQGCTGGTMDRLHGGACARPGGNSTPTPNKQGVRTMRSEQTQPPNKQGARAMQDELEHGLAFGRLAATPDDPRPSKNGSLLTEAEHGVLDSEVVVL